MNMSTVFIELEDVNLLMPFEYFLFEKREIITVHIIANGAELEVLLKRAKVTWNEQFWLREFNSFHKHSLARTAF